MSCKRKRSADDSPLSVSSFGAVSTPGTQSPIPFPQSFHGCMQMDVDPSARQNGWDFASASRVKSGDWGNRTRKRFRDNRADERAIHGMSLGFLGAAEPRANCMQRTPSDATPAQQPTLAISKPQKSTLHSFWKQLPAPPVQQPIFSYQTQQQQIDAQLQHCDDCDTPLQSVNDSMDVDMDMDMGGAVESSPFACGDCGKNVCGTCAVVSARRHCLECATNRRSSGRFW
jgi:hypothetical protein